MTYDLAIFSYSISTTHQGYELSSGELGLFYGGLVLTS